MSDISLDEIEFCVSCGAETQYKKSDHIDKRTAYIEGAGQLCSRCHYNQLCYKDNIFKTFAEVGQDLR